MPGELVPAGHRGYERARTRAADRVTPGRRWADARPAWGVRHAFCPQAGCILVRLAWPGVRRLYHQALLAAASDAHRAADMAQAMSACGTFQGHWIHAFQYQATLRTRIHLAHEACGLLSGAGGHLDDVMLRTGGASAVHS